MCNSTLYIFHKVGYNLNICGCVSLKYWKHFVMKNIWLMWLVKFFCSFPYHRDVCISDKSELISNNLEFHLLWVTGTGKTKVIGIGCCL